MALRDTMNSMQQLIAAITKDLAKAARGNKTAAQRVRTATIRFQTIAKLFRKESVNAEKSGKFKYKKKKR